MKAFAVRPTGLDLYDEITGAFEFEHMGRGRAAAIAADVDAAGLVPLVRTTAAYTRPAYAFAEVHRRVIQRLREVFGADLAFDNVMMEHYDCTYRSMRFHTDMALDLADESHICLLSFYEYVAAPPTRQLVVRSKFAIADDRRIPLEHGSAVLFSTADNAAHVHKICSVGKSAARGRGKWLGLTFRASKGWVRPGELRLATDDERHELYRRKSAETKKIEYVWADDDLTRSCTLSPGDLLTPVAACGRRD